MMMKINEAEHKAREARLGKLLDSWEADPALSEASSRSILSRADMILGQNIAAPRFAGSILKTAMALAAALLLMVLYKNTMTDLSIENLKTLRTLNASDRMKVNCLKFAVRDTVLFEMIKNKPNTEAVINLETAMSVPDKLSSNEQAADIKELLGKALNAKRSARFFALNAADDFVAVVEDNLGVKLAFAAMSRIYGSSDLMDADKAQRTGDFVLAREKLLLTEKNGDEFFSKLSGVMLKFLNLREKTSKDVSGNRLSDGQLSNAKLFLLDYDSALEAFDAEAKLNSGDRSQNAFKTAWCLKMKGDFSGAIKMLKKIDSVEMKKAATYETALIYMDTGDTKKAKETISPAETEEYPAFYKKLVEKYLKNIN
jgi:tetratricopeptide (TPR) repeat protein